MRLQLIVDLMIEVESNIVIVQKVNGCLLFGSVVIASDKLVEKFSQSLKESFN